jgi:hypothetical protein
MNLQYLKDLFKTLNLYTGVFIIITLVVLSKNITFFKLIFVYCLFVMNQLIVIHTNKTKSDTSFKYKKLDHIKSQIQEHLLHSNDLINSNKMKFDDWVQYNEKNMIKTIGKDKFYVFVFEYINHQNDFKTLIHANKTYVKLTWADIMRDQHENFNFIKQETDPKLIHNMYDIGTPTTPNTIQYYWTDPLAKTLIKKESFFFKWHDSITKKSGVIGMGFNIDDVLESNKVYYSNYLHTSYLFILNLIVMAITYITYFVSKLKLKSVTLLLISAAYIITFLNTRELIGSFKTETTKTQDLTNTMLGISFLIGVNIFILNSLKKEFNLKLFIESGLIFSLSLILLLFSMFKVTSYMNIDELMQDRISNQLLFNFSVLLNIIVIVNYIFFVASRSKSYFTNPFKI